MAGVKMVSHLDATVDDSLWLESIRQQSGFESSPVETEPKSCRMFLMVLLFWLIGGIAFLASCGHVAARNSAVRRFEDHSEDFFYWLLFLVGAASLPCLLSSKPSGGTGTWKFIAFSVLVLAACANAQMPRPWGGWGGGSSGAGDGSSTSSSTPAGDDSSQPAPKDYSAQFGGVATPPWSQFWH